MIERLSMADVAFLHLETRATPQHVGGVSIFQPPSGGLDYDRLIGLLEERISLVPRYRQKIRAVPGSLANPVWLDDPAFDITYHVRRSALPRPGTEEVLLDFCARIQARLLDRSRPLWEMYLVEGLADGRVAIVTKTHSAMVDGLAAVDIGEVLLDASAQPRRTVSALWMPEPEPSDARLVVDALSHLARRPAASADLVRMSLQDARATAGRVRDVAGMLGSAVTGALRISQPSPLSAGPGEHRRIAIARTDLEDFRRVRAGLGCTVNDAILATVAGALRCWLLSRGEPLRATTSVRTLVPVSTVSDLPGNQVTGLLVDLPVGEADPVNRVMLVHQAMATSGTGATARPLAADVLRSVSGFAPPTLHALGARAANGLTRRAYALAVTNVPGPQFPLYAAGARMTDIFPILPLSKGQAVSIAMTSYDGGVYFGVNGDRDAVPDVAALAGYLAPALAELLEACGATREPAGVGASPRGSAVPPGRRS